MQIFTFLDSEHQEPFNPAYQTQEDSFSDSLCCFVFVDSPKKKSKKGSSSKKSSSKAKKSQREKDRKKKKQKVKISKVPNEENWKYIASLVGFAAVASLLRRSALAQVVFTGTFYLYLLWFSLRLEKMYLSTSYS